jgi:hypothetical protein
MVETRSIQEFPNILWTPKVHYRLHKSPPLVPIVRQITPVHTTPSYLSKIQLNIILPSMSRSSYCYISLLISHQNLTSTSPRACYIPCQSSSLTWSLWLYLAKSIIYDASHYAVFSNLLLLCHSLVQVFSSAPCSQTPSVYISSLTSETKVDTHTRSQAKL